MNVNVVGLFCEDIRAETSGQFTLVGTLPDNVNVPAPQGGKGHAVIPKLALFIRINLPIGVKPDRMSITLQNSKGGTSSLGPIEQNLIEQSMADAKKNGLPFAGIIHHVVFKAFPIMEPSVFTAVLHMGDKQYTCAVMNVSQPSTTASEPPSEQSPPAAPAS